jgi:2-dehydro-3-deoxygluconokinase
MAEKQSSTMKWITTFGEIMMRISPSDSGELIHQASQFDIRPGGSESNVAIALANLGLQTRFVTSIPDNPLGEKVIRTLKAEGVDTSFIRKTNGRLGNYWTETGLGPRSSNVIYDREPSAINQSGVDDYRWNQILEECQWFHFSGISPAVSESITTLLEKVVDQIGCPYSVDLNFRKLLWDWTQKEPTRIHSIMANLCRNATLIAGNESDFQQVLGFQSNEESEHEVYTAIAEQAFAKFPSLKFLAISNRNATSATINQWSGYLFVKHDALQCHKGLDYTLDAICDRVGTGDSFVAGIIYGLLHRNEMSYQQIIDFAVTLGALNHTTKGDASHFKVEQVIATLNSNGSGRIIR